MIDPSLADLHEVLDLATARAGDLLTAGEQRIVDRIRALDGPPAVLYARLSSRVPPAFLLDALEVAGVDDVPGASARLAGDELADGVVPWPLRAELLPRRELVEACARLGLPRSGRKPELAARLAPLRGWHPGRWLRLRHRGLLRRLERFAFLHAWPDRSTLVVARLGVVRWPEYARTAGAGLFPTRRALLDWEELLDGVDDVEQALDALRRRVGQAPARLDLERWLRRGLRERAESLERSAPDAAAELYRRLVAEAGERPARVAFRHARAEESAGRPEIALDILRRARESATDEERLALARAGRRLSRRVRGSWAPERPLRALDRRSVRLPMAPPGPRRPRWRVEEAAEPIEQAVCSWLSSLGRRAVHAEGRPWSTLFALLFAPTYFLPVPGALPVRFLSGPLDLGTPRFRAARAEAVDAVLAAIDRCEAPARVADAWDRWHGTRLAGARWDGLDRELLRTLAAGMGPAGLRAVLEPLLDGGSRAAAGLPDLAVLPGPAVRLPDAHPSRLPDGLLLAEVKGPTDALRDSQRVWLDRLARAGVAVELWEVSAPPSR